MEEKFCVCANYQCGVSDLMIKECIVLDYDKPFTSESFCTVEFWKDDNNRDHFLSRAFVKRSDLFDTYEQAENDLIQTISNALSRMAVHGRMIGGRFPQIPKKTEKDKKHEKA